MANNSPKSPQDPDLLFSPTNFIYIACPSQQYGERCISIQSRGHSDYRLTGDLHAPLQRAEHVFISFLPPFPLSFHGPEQLIQGFLIEQNTGEMERAEL